MRSGRSRGVATIATALIAVPVYGIARELDSNRGPAIAAAAVAATAAASFYLSVEFVKNGVGLTMAAGGIWAVLVAERKKGRAWVALACGLAVATWLTHKSAASLLVIGAAPLAIPWLVAKKKAGLAVAAAAAIALGLVSWVFPERFVGTADLGLARDLFGGGFDWRLPVLSLPGGRRDHYGYEVFLALGACALFWLLHRKSDGPRRSVYVIGGLTAFALLCALPTLEVGNPNALGFRIRLLAFFGLALTAGPTLSLALARATPLTRAAIGLGLAGFIVAARPAAYTAPVVEQHPALVAAVRAADGAIPQGDAIVTPERRLAFMATWFTRRSAAQRPEAIETTRRWRLLPLPYMSGPLLRAIEAERASSSDAGLIRSLHPHDPLGLVLIAEASWSRILSRLTAAERARYDAWPTY